jgi:hypothetical protein
MSVPFIGRLIELGIGKETSRGAGAAAAYWIPKVSFDHDVKINRAVSAASFGNISAETTGYVTEQFAQGGLESEIRDKSFGLFLLSLLGAISSASDSGAYKHTFTLQNDNAHQSLGFSYKDSISSLVFKLAMIDELTIEVAAGEIAKFSASFLSKTAADNAVAFSPSYVQENRFTAKHASLKIAASTAQLAAASATSIKRFSLTIAKNLIRTSVLGSLEPEDILNTIFRISGKIELDYKNRTLRNYMLAGTIQALRFQLSNSDVAIGTTNPTFLIDLPKVQFHEWEHAGGLDDIVGETINFTAFYDAVNNQIWSDCHLRNEVASY